MGVGLHIAEVANLVGDPARATTLLQRQIDEGARVLRGRRGHKPRRD